MINQARQKLSLLEQHEAAPQPMTRPAAKTSRQVAVTPQADLFSSPEPHPAIEVLDKTNLDNLTPRQALDLLYTLKDLGR